MRDFSEFVSIVGSEEFRSEVREIEDGLTSIHDETGDAYVSMRSETVTLLILRRYHEWLSEQLG